MANESGLLFEIKCPCCGATLQIDAEMQLVLNHREPEKKLAIEDLQSAVQQLKGEAQRRNDVFEKSFASHRTGEEARSKKFDELLKQAKQDGPDKPPARPFDLD